MRSEPITVSARAIAIGQCIRHNGVATIALPLAYAEAVPTVREKMTFQTEFSARFLLHLDHAPVTDPHNVPSACPRI
jgi:hypothetical protein